MSAVLEAPPVAAELAAGIDRVTYLTIPNVEILTVGMKWHAATGDVTYTLDHLADAVLAENDDPHILSPRLRVGHFDPRFNEEPHTWDPFAYHGELREDGNPVFGKVANLRLVNDGAVIVGDYVEVPDWLAHAAPSAYPSRSQENTWDVEPAFEVQTAGGKRYSMVITSVALLGEAMPAITDLEDLVRLLTGGPAAVTARADAAASARPSTARRPMAEPAATTASTDSVVESFWDDFAQDDRLWWWPREFWVDAGQIIADDDEGHLYRVSFTADNDGNVNWAEPVRGVLDFRDVPAAASQFKSSKPDRVYVTAAEARPRDRVRPVAANVNEGGTMNDEQKALAVKLGLGEDATVEQLNEKLQADALQSNEPPAEGEVTPPDPTPVADPEPPAGTAVSLDRATFEQLKREAADGAAARAEQVATRQREKVESAVRAGKFPPARREHYLALMAKDEDGTTAFIDGLETGAIPVNERGANPKPEDDGEAMTRVLDSFGLTSHRKEQ